MLKLLILTHRWVSRLVIGVSIALFCLLAAAILSLRYWILPDIGRHQDRIAAQIGRAIGERVEIGRIQADWTGAHPHLAMRDVRIYDPSGHPALTLDQVDSQLSWLTFLTGEIRFASLEIDQPRLGVRRDASGRVYVAGIPVTQGGGNAALSDWLLHQRQVVIRDGFVLWEDDQAHGPPLMLNSVNFALINSRNHHLFGLQAVPPGEVSSPLDVRANLFGESLDDLSSWRGKIYARVDRTDISVLRKWLPLPDRIASGRGGIRMWMDFANSRPQAVTADIDLYGVRARLGRQIPPLGIRFVRGRLGWSGEDGDNEFYTRRLSLETESGERIRSTDFMLQSIPERARNAEQGEITANTLDLGILARLATSFPLPPAARDALAKYAPSGKLENLQVTWKGEEPATVIFPWQRPREKSAKGAIPAHYSVKAKFSGLGLESGGNAFRNLSGHLDADESGGNLNLDAPHAALILPGIFETPIALDTLTAQGGWKRNGGDTEISVGNLSFSNRDLSGNAFGSFRSSARYADFTGRLTRADATRVWRYLPLVVGKSARDWVKNGLVGGKSDDVRFRLKGKLDRFPFADGKDGLFQVKAKVSGGSLRYAPGWPGVDSISADLLFQGARMEITSSDAAILGTKVSRCRVSVVDLAAPRAVLEVDGEVKGPTDEFLRFIEASPVSGYIGGFTSGMRASGNGMLGLKLGIPLEHAVDTRVAGSFQFLGDRITGPTLPVMDRLAGRLDFTEKGISAKSASAVILGGNALINASTADDGSLKVSVSGKIDPSNLQGAFARHFSGKADWHAGIAVRRKGLDIVIQSSLKGLASSLPAPLSKDAESPMPLRVELKSSSDGEDVLTAALGSVLSARFLGETGRGSLRVDQGLLYLNEDMPATLPDAPGIRVIGSLPEFDADRWRDILDESAGGQSPISFSGIDVDIGTLAFLGRHFGKLSISARQSGGEWDADLSGKEVQGSIRWIPEGKGRLVGKFVNLGIPDAPPAEAVESKVTLAKVASRDLPALDISAESFVIRKKEIGKLELVAVQQGNDWKIEKLRIVNPDSVLSASGLWQGWAIHPRTDIDLRLDVHKIGPFLSRFGYPDNIMRGSGKMEGTLSWAGSPQAINYDTLNGNISLTANHGQFNKIDPGIGKLLGILSLQELPRRITLDFRDIFSQGFAFDGISSSFRISHGIAETGNLRISGPAAEVDMTGKIDLDRETQDLAIVVKPQLGGSVSVASSLLGGPVVGIATWVVGKVLQDPLDQLAAYEYNVTGSWKDPVVKKAHEKR